MQWIHLAIILGVCAVMCAVGFYKFVYFLSIGYGFAIAGGGIAAAIIIAVSGMNANWAMILPMTILFVLYGARLSGFLLIREIKNANYRKTLKEATGGDKKMPIFVAAVIWIFCAILYVMQVSPMYYRALNECQDIIIPIIGMVISVIGIVIESLADKQKSDQKKVNPKMVATKGLYKIVRCPNYFGEILFWTGVLIAGITAYKTWYQWVIAVTAWVCIVYVMIDGAKRLEKRQLKNYGDKKEYRDYANSTPIIIPLIPVYHLVKEAK